MKVVVVSHDPRWARKFEAEAAIVNAALGPAVSAIHHIGSTAVPGIYAKPIIDMLVEAASSEAVDAREATLVGRGYEAMGEFGLPGRRYFRKDDAKGNREYQIHAYAAGSAEVVRHLAFRDYLRSHPAVAKEYSGLKRELAKRYPSDIEGYMNGKDAFIKSTEQAALAWWRSVERASDSQSEADSSRLGVSLMSVQHLSRADLEAGLADIRESPRETGQLAMIVQRPAVNERREVPAGALSVEEGLVGDNWKDRRRPHPDTQLTLMNSRVAALVAQDPTRWSLAGDQLYVDLDLSLDNLPPGTRLRIRDALVEVTAVPHRGCRKFVDRFGHDAMVFVNSDTGCRLNLRGINAKVIEGGEIGVNDAVSVERRGPS